MKLLPSKPSRLCSDVSPNSSPAASHAATGEKISLLAYLLNGNGNKVRSSASRESGRLRRTPAREAGQVEGRSSIVRLFLKLSPGRRRGQTGGWDKHAHTD